MFVSEFPNEEIFNNEFFDWMDIFFDFCFQNKDHSLNVGIYIILYEIQVVRRCLYETYENLVKLHIIGCKSILILLM